MAKHSKPYLTFCNRLAHFNADLELVDIVVSSVTAGMLSTDDKLFTKLSKQKHPVLSKRKVNKTNRTNAINHLRQSIFSSFLKDLYEEVYSYLKSVLAEASVNSKIDPARFIGDQKVEIKAVDILQADKLQSIIEDIVSKMFHQLENKRSTKELLEGVRNKLNICVDKEVEDKAVYYLEIRHQLVHADGKADYKFKVEHPDLFYTTDDYIDLRYRLIQKARKAIVDFVVLFDTEVVSRGIISSI